MERKGTSLFANGLIWFGAGISLAEILAGTAYAPMPLGKGIAAILLGHLIGGILMFLAGMIGARTKRSAMETVKLSFGTLGALFFCVLNIAQLAGWTAIMIYDGGLAANGIFHTNRWVWCVVIGLLIILWIHIGIKRLNKVNTVAMTGLFVLTLVLCKVIFVDGKGMFAVREEAMSFGAALELSVAMPISWLPLISDYTREAEKPVAATAVSALAYGAISCWMYIIGMGASALAGSSDIAQIMLKAGLGLAGLVIIVFSTVTTTFLDAYSAGVSGAAVSPRVSDRRVAVLITVLGTLCAVSFPMDDITGFLYLIGSVFAPMIAVQIADFFILRTGHGTEKFAAWNLAIWFIGFVLYRIFMRVDWGIGSTLPAMLSAIALCVAVSQLTKKAVPDKPQ